MSTRFFTNDSSSTLLKKFEGIFDHNPNLARFNALSHEFDDVKFAADEFEKLWDESVTVLPKELKKVTDNTFLRKDLTFIESTLAPTS